MTKSGTAMADVAVSAPAPVVSVKPVVLSALGRGEDLQAEHFPFMNPGFTDMATPTLVIAGDRDQSALSVRGPDW